MTDIESIVDCRKLVDRFYEDASRDALLGPVFATRLQRSWPEHLETMSRFWGTVLFGEALYQGRPVDLHATLPLEGAHFSRWLTLWTFAVDALFRGERAEHAKRAAARMARRLESAVEHPSPVTTHAA